MTEAAQRLALIEEFHAIPRGKDERQQFYEQLFRFVHRSNIIFDVQRTFLGFVTIVRNLGNAPTGAAFVVQ
jgi:hypothetical protein